MARRSMLQAAGAALVILASCGDSGDGVQMEASSSSHASSTTSVDDIASWCDEFGALGESRNVGGLGIAGAPDEIRAQLEVLAGAASLDPNNTPPDTLGSLVVAQAAVESWGHEHCGGDHPFCSLWITVEGVMAASAFSDADEETVAEELGLFLDEVDGVLAEYAPSEMRGHVQTFVAFLDSETSTLSDDMERAAEAATAALDEWAWSQGCQGATQPFDE